MKNENLTPGDKSGKSARRRKKGNKRTKEQQAYDIAFCSDLFLKGCSYREIAERLNKDLLARNAGYTITLAMVFYDMQQCLIEWKKQKFDNIELYVEKELQTLDRMQWEAWEAWEASKRGKNRTKERTDKRTKIGYISPVSDDKEPESIEYGYDETTVETSPGNPRFLDLVLNIQQRRAKLLGIDAPIKIDIPGYNREGNSDDKPKYDAKVIPDDMLFALADKLQEAEYQKILDEKEGKR